MIDVLFVDGQVILVTTALMSSVTVAMNLVTLHKTAPTRFLPQEHHVTKTNLIQGIDIPTPKGTDHTPPTMVTDMGDISTNHNPVSIPTTTGAAVSEYTHCAPHQATTEAHAALWLMDAPTAIHTMTHPTGIVTPHPPFATSPKDITHAIIPPAGAGLTPVTLTALHRKHSQERTSHTQDLQPPINPIIPRLSLSRTPCQILPQIQTATLIL